MARPTEIQIVKHVSFDELESTLQATLNDTTTKKKSEKLIKRMQFVKLRYMGYSVEQASAATGFTSVTGYSVQKSWNSNGIEGLVPDFKGGPKSKITEEQKQSLKGLLSKTPMDTKSVRQYIEKNFGYDYSDKQVHVILHNMGLRHAKPYPNDYRRPSNAEEILKKDSVMLWMV